MSWTSNSAEYKKRHVRNVVIGQQNLQKENKVMYQHEKVPIRLMSLGSIEVYA